MRKILARLDAAAAQPENERRMGSEIWRWWRRHPILLVIAALISARLLYDVWMLYGWRPDVVVEGQIVDYDTKQPAEGAWVLIEIRASGRYFDSNGKLIWYVPEGGSTSMTSPMSTVVQTDEEGRFYYRVSAYDAYQYASYTVHGVNLGVYKPGYESVDSLTGRSERGGENYLAFMSPAPGRDWPSLKRVGDSLEQRRLSRDDFPAGADVAPSDVTWPQWARFVHAVAADEIKHWCNAPSASAEDRSYAALLEASKLVFHQEAFLVNPYSDGLAGVHARWSRDQIDSRYRAFSADYRLAAPEYPWPTYGPPADASEAELPRLAAMKFTNTQQEALCDVMRRQSEAILQQSLVTRGPE